MKEFQGKSVLVRVIIIKQGRVSEGSSYRQSTFLRSIIPQWIFLRVASGRFQEFSKPAWIKSDRLNDKKVNTEREKQPAPAQIRDFETHHKALEFEAQFELKMWWEFCYR